MHDVLAFTCFTGFFDIPTVSPSDDFNDDHLHSRMALCSTEIVSSVSAGNSKVNIFLRVNEIPLANLLCSMLTLLYYKKVILSVAPCHVPGVALNGTTSCPFPLIKGI